MRPLWGTLAMLLLCAVARAQQPAPQDPKILLQEHDCQLELPGGSGGRTAGDGVADPTGPKGARASGERRREEQKPWQLPMCGMQFAEALLWLCVGGAAVLLVIAIVRGIGARRDRPATVSPVRGKPVAAAPPAEDAPLPEHAVLAQSGDYAGALAAVLRQAIAAFVRGGGSAPAHDTARGILRRIARERSSGSRGEQAFRSLVQQVERIRFAGDPAGAADYEAALPHLRQWEDAWTAK